MPARVRYLFFFAGCLKAVFFSCPCMGISATPPDVYLLIGQSNMAGRAEVTDAEALPVDRLLLLNETGQWEPATHPLNKYSTIRKKIEMQRLNPGYGFAIAMLEADPDVTIGLVVNARGGTRIEEWEKGTAYYSEAVKRANAAMQSGTLQGILWHQGESNSRNPEQYTGKIIRLIRDLRQDLGAPDLPFVAGQVFHDPVSKPHTEKINAVLASLPERISNVGCARSDGLTTFDNTHFDTTGMQELGRRYAEIMLGLQAKQSHLTRNKHSTGADSESYPAGMENEILLRALELDKQGDWEGAHNLAQDVHSANGSWLHAYLHRKEGDPGNAAYWYSRAGQPVAEDSLDDEWMRLKAAFSGE